MTVIEQLSRDLADDLARIAERFKPGAKLTLVVRNPSIDGDAGVLISDDDLDLAIAEIRRRQSIEPTAELIARSSIGAALADIATRGIDAHLVELEAEMKPKRRRRKR